MAKFLSFSLFSIFVENFLFSKKGKERGKKLKQFEKMFRSLRKRVLTSRSAHWVKANVTVADVPAFDETEFHNFKIDKGSFFQIISILF